MTRRRKVIILVTLIVVILAAIVWFGYDLLNQQEPAPEPVQEMEEQDVPDDEPDEPTISDQQEEQEQEERNQTAGLQSLTKTFVQRYGSYSSEANFANLEDVMPLMTDAFAEETRQYIAENDLPDEYYGVTTRTVSLEVVERDEALGTAVLRATTQREEAHGSPQNTSVTYQDIVIEYELVDEVWKVSNATWE